MDNSSTTRAPDNAPPVNVGSFNGQVHRPLGPAYVSQVGASRFTDYTADELKPPKQPKQPTDIGISAADIEPVPLEWLWHNRIPLGKLTIIQGDPDIGKSLITLDLAARLSRGDPMPNCATGSDRPRRSLILTTEDDPDDTIVPRLIAAEADLSMIRIVLPDQFASLASTEDWARLELYARTCGDLGLIVFDPLSAYLGRGDHGNAEVRKAMTPLFDFAQRHKTTIIGMNHLTKDSDRKALYRGQGNIALTAGPRAVLQVSKDKDDPDRRIVLPVKSNLTPDKTGVAYSIVSVPVTFTDRQQNHPCIAWAPGVFTMDPNEALEWKPSTKKAAATDWLRTVFKKYGGKMTAAEVSRLADDEGISDSTLHRAKSELGVRSKQGDGGQFTESVWWLPGRSPTPEDPEDLTTHLENRRTGEPVADLNGLPDRASPVLKPVLNHTTGLPTEADVENRKEITVTADSVQPGAPVSRSPGSGAVPRPTESKDATPSRSIKGKNDG